MRQRQEMGILLRAASLLLPLVASAAEASDRYQGWLDASFSADGPGATALVMRGGSNLFVGAAGMADLELGVEMTPGHVLRIGSITKQFTAAAILLLEEQGKLDTGDVITDYLPDYPTHGHRITLEHLLTHTSGIYNYTDTPGYFGGAAIRADIGTEELIGLFAHRPMNFAPGEEHRYSNSGYALLGAIIEVASGQDYADYMRDAILEPLGLSSTEFGGTQIVPGRAKGYAGHEGSYRNAAYISMTHAHGAGALISTVDDLARWNAALFAGELLSPATVDRMVTDFELNDGGPAGYGYGFRLGERFDLRVVTHTGGIPGFATSAFWLPGPRVYAVVLSNLEGTRHANHLAERLAFDAAGVDLPSFAEIDVDPASLVDYVGEYRINENETRRVGIDGDELYTQRGDGPRSAVLAHGEDAFFYPASFTHLAFDRDRSGRVVAMEMYHDGSAEPERAVRISDAMAAPRTE